MGIQVEQLGYSFNDIFISSALCIFILAVLYARLGLRMGAVPGRAFIKLVFWVCDVRPCELWVRSTEVQTRMGTLRQARTASLYFERVVSEFVSVPSHHVFCCLTISVGSPRLYNHISYNNRTSN